MHGTEFVFDYSEPLERAPGAVLARYQKAAKWVATSGEPWITFFTPVDIGKALRDRGFVSVHDLDATAQNASWFVGRPNTLVVAPLAHLVQASVKAVFVKSLQPHLATTMP